MDKIDLRYQRGKIYTIRRYDDDTAIYVGSTIQPLSARMAKHRSNKKCSLYQYVNGNWDNWYIELYEEYPCNNKQLLEKREGEITRLIGNINKKIQGRTKQEYYEDNKEKLLDQNKKYRIDNKEKILKKKKDYREANNEKIKETAKKYRENNKEKIVERYKRYYENNKEKLLDQNKIKVICDHCGCESTKQNLKRHQLSKKCINFVKKD